MRPQAPPREAWLPLSLEFPCRAEWHRGQSLDREHVLGLLAPVCEIWVDRVQRGHPLVEHECFTLSMFVGERNIRRIRDGAR